MLFNEKKRKLTPAQFDREVERLSRWVVETVSPFEDDTPAKQQRRVRRALRDQDYFNKTYLPHYFTQASPRFHREIEAQLDASAKQERPSATAAPRNHAKSTRITLARPLRQVLGGHKKFIILISDTELQAKSFTVSIRIELEHNARILHDFGPHKTANWAAGDFVTAGNSRVLARGDQQRVRGLKHGAYRPDEIVIDDIDSDEMVRNPRRIKQTYDWIMEAVYPSLEPGKGSMAILGTLLSKRSVLARCLANKEFISSVYRAIDGGEWSEEKGEFVKGKPLWSERFTLKRLSAIRRLIGSLSFNKEYQNDPKDDDGLFKEEWIKRISWNDLPNVPLFTFSGRDPSLKQGQSNDYKAGVVVSRGEGKLYVRHASIKKISIDRMVKEDFNLVRRYSCLQLGLETDGWQALLRRDYDREGELQKFYLPIVPIERHGVSKESEARIGHLSPLVENGVIVFCQGPEREVGDMELLIEQLIYFPSTTVNDDGPDALEIAVHLAERRVAGRPSYERVARREARFGPGAY